MNIKKAARALVPDFLLSFYHWLWSFLGAVAYGFPSRKLVVIGVTGTSGKSTTVDFITKILEEAGNTVVSNSSIRFKVAGKEWPNSLKMSMPGRFFMQKLLQQGVAAGCRYAVLEITSEGIRQHRHKFICFDTAAFTNLSKEHIESHGSFEHYRAEKLKLFLATKNTHIINADDENQKYFFEIPSLKKITFGLQGGDVKAEQVSSTSFVILGMPIKLSLLGEFNIYNALAAICVANHYGISLSVCKKALEEVKAMPGRMEIVHENPLVVVDYAHTPDQLEGVYKSLSGKPLVCVLGSCGGGRDKWKRPVLGAIAEQYCREIFVTNEDPYDEDPWEIINQIDEGITNKERTRHLILDRKEAIQKALAVAQSTDTVIITGKGSENVMCLASGKKIPWDDRQIAREDLSH